MSTFPLEQLLDVIDRLPIRYKRTSNIKILVPGLDIAQRFPGTDVPAVIDCNDVPRKHRGECVYQEWWQCCGEYGCTTGDKSMKKTSPAYHCKARMCVQVFATADGGCVASIAEDGPSMHGSRHRPPDAAERYTWRSKVIIAKAAADGVQKIGDLLSEHYWDDERVPLPRTTKEKNSLRNRLAQLRRKLAKKTKEEEDEEEEEESESELPPLDEPVIERVLETRVDAATGKRMQLVKWKEWPESSATWQEAPASPSASNTDDDATTVRYEAAAEAEAAQIRNEIRQHSKQRLLTVDELAAASDAVDITFKGAVMRTVALAIGTAEALLLPFMTPFECEERIRKIRAFPHTSERTRQALAMYCAAFQHTRAIYNQMNTDIADTRAMYVCDTVVRITSGAQQRTTINEHRRSS